MSVRTCPSCGSDYLSGVERCVDCDVELVDAQTDDVDGEGIASLGDDEQLVYELIGYANETKVALDGMLTEAGVVHVWQAGDLIVRAADRDAVDPLVEEASTFEEPLLGDDEVVYEIIGIDDGQRSDLEAMLLADDIEFAWDDDGHLVVLAADEDRVEPILDRLDMADELTADDVEASGGDDADGGPDEVDGLAAQTTMSDLFVVVDKLMKDPGDRGLRAELTAASERMGSLRTPFGFSAANWSDLQERAAVLAEAADADERDDEQVKLDARALREALHQYV